MLTGKQRSYLRARANKMDPVLHIGKEDISEAVVEQLDEALTDHELVKGRVLNNSMMDSRTAAGELAERCNCDVVQVIGNIFILFRRNQEEPIYNLP